ncbi:FMN-binding negative transcriptional regulator [Tardiphaga robiniae]|uniref:FMN-binding negative transcriptional regulator n=1 Tax=Tardiphaga robiniae TaxID=943830 RepID=UPI0023EB0D1F|nr:FMN-binding negative transcriptional regulator [Tardiphaga robiniae]
MTRTHKAGEPTPWKMTDSSKEFIDMMMKAIVGIEFEITRLVGKSKLSQNREQRDIETAGQKLSERGECVVSDAMKIVSAAKTPA